MRCYNSYLCASSFLLLALAWAWQEPSAPSANSPIPARSSSSDRQLPGRPAASYASAPQKRFPVVYWLLRV